MSVPEWLGVLAELGRRAGGGDLDTVVAGLGPVTLRMADDIHVEPAMPGVSAVAVHRESWRPIVAVSVHLEPGRSPTRADVEGALGAGQQLPHAPDARGAVELSYPAPQAWGVPDGSTVTLTVDRDDRVQAARVDVPQAASDG